MIAYSLVNLIEHIDSEKETMKTIAAGGFRDVTRIAASSPVMWENICESNKNQLLSLMDQYEANFHKLRVRISTRCLSILLTRQAVLQCLQAF